MKVFVFSLVFFHFSLAQALNHIRSVNSFSKGNEFFVKVLLSKNISKQDVEIDYINRTVQFEINQSQFKKIKKSYKTSFKKVNNIYVYQSNPGKNKTRVRVNFKKPIKAHSYKKFIEWDVEGNELFITFLDPSKKVVPVQEKKTEVKKENKNPIVLKEKPVQDLRQVAQKKEKKDLLSVFEGSVDTNLFLFSLLVLLLFIYFRRPYRMFLKKGSLTLLDSCELDEKTKLCLVKHGSKKYIVSYSKNEIQILKEDVTEDHIELKPKKELLKINPEQQEEKKERNVAEFPLKIKQSVQALQTQEAHQRQENILLKIKNMKEAKEKCDG